MKTYLESEETKLLEISATNPRDRLLIRLLSRLGCRVSEALALSVEDVDLSERYGFNRQDDSVNRYNLALRVVPHDFLASI